QALGAEEPLWRNTRQQGFRWLGSLFLRRLAPEPGQDVSAKLRLLLGRGTKNGPQMCRQATGVLEEWHTERAELEEQFVRHQILAGIDAVARPTKPIDQVA